MQKKRSSTLRRTLAVLLSVVMALGMTIPAFALRGGYDAASPYVDDLGRDAVNMPVTGRQELDLTDKSSGYTFKVYDDGGRTADCSYAKKDGWLLIEAPEGFVIQFAGWVNISYYSDYLTVYDGDNENADSWTLENVISYRPREFGCLVTAGNAMLLHFTGPELYTSPGFELSVTLVSESATFGITYADAPHGRVYGTERAQAGAQAMIVAKPDPGYVLKSISVKDANGDDMLPLYPSGCIRDDLDSVIYSDDGLVCWNAAPLWYIGGNRATFTMPASAVTVEYEMAPISEGLSINMPIEGWGVIDIPEEVQTFKLYDDGGPDGEFSRYNGVMATLVAPEGYRLRVEGSAEPQADREDCSLTLTDGATFYDPTLAEVTGVSESHEFGPVESSGEHLFLYFSSGWNEDHYAGFDVTVTLIPDDTYAGPVWTWAADYSSATATFSCNEKTVAIRRRDL